jgi:hypothetical protein
MCSGSISAPGAADRVRRRRSSSAGARHAVVSATTRSPCLLHGLLRESPEGPGESRHVDLLAWNGDSTRLPAAMCLFYLRSCYLENQLAAGTTELAGRRLDLAAVLSDTYIVAAERDHIVP